MKITDLAISAGCEEAADTGVVQAVGEINGEWEIVSSYDDDAIAAMKRPLYLCYPGGTYRVMKSHKGL